jgi:hypothetical protein
MGSKSPMRPWQATPPRHRVPRVVAFAGWAIAMGSILTLGKIEDAARKQPSTADATFSHAYSYKGTWRYITDRQAEANEAANLCMGLGVFVFAGGAIWVAIVEILAAKHERAPPQPTDWGDV